MSRQRRELRSSTPGSELQRLTVNENLILGVLSGAGCKCINYPLMVWKNAVQQGRPLPLHPSLVYRGLPMALIQPMAAVQFFCTGFFQRFLRDHAMSTQRTTMMGGAFLGGLVSGLPCCAFELTMIQQQRFGGTILGTLTRLRAESGSTVLLRGLSVTMGREGMFTLAMLGITPSIQHELMTMDAFPGPMDRTSALAIGSIAGSVLAATVTHPMDTIKTCLQADVKKETFTTVGGALRKLMADNGSSALFRGLPWRISLISTTFFLVNGIKEKLAPSIFPSSLE